MQINFESRPDLSIIFLCKILEQHLSCVPKNQLIGRFVIFRDSVVKQSVSGKKKVVSFLLPFSITQKELYII